MSYQENLVLREERRSKKTVAKAAVACACAGALAVGGVMAYLTATDTATNNFTVSEPLSINVVETNNGTDVEGLKYTDVLPGETYNKDPRIVNLSNVDGYAFMQVDIPAQVLKSYEDKQAGKDPSFQQLFTYEINSGWTEVVKDGNSWERFVADDEATETYEEQIYDKLQKTAVNDSTYGDKGTITRYYIYETELKAKDDTNTADETTKLFEKVKFINFMNLNTQGETNPDSATNANLNILGEQRSITVTGHAVQSLGFKNSADNAVKSNPIIAAWNAYVKQNDYTQGNGSNNWPGNTSTWADNQTDGTPAAPAQGGSE